MAWQIRPGRRPVYFRSVRIGGKVVRQYIGSGPEAERIAAADAQRRAEGKAKVEMQKTERARLETTATPLSDFSAQLELLMRAELLAAGCHQHAHCEWRRRHVKTISN